MKTEHADFLRRVANGEVYTGLSGEALARWAVGWGEHPADHPHDASDFARCMNVYVAAPEDLRPKMRGWLEAQLLRLAHEANRRRLGEWARPVVDFNNPVVTDPPDRDFRWLA